MTIRAVVRFACDACEDTGELTTGPCSLCLAGRASREMQQHFDAQMRKDFDRVFAPREPKTVVHRQQEGRVIRVCMDEGVATRDAIG